MSTDVTGIENLDSREEVVDHTFTDVELEDTSSEDAPIKPWNPDEIRIQTRHFSIRQMIDMIDDEEVDLAPDFQRAYVWKAKQRCGLIESVLLGIPLPSFYLNEDSDGKMQVVDGVQRLTSIHKFYHGDFSLCGLTYLEELNGKLFSDIEATVFGRRFKNTQLVAHVIAPQTPARVKYDIFKRLNTGGTPLTAQEIRHCMSRDRSRNFLRHLTQLPVFTDVMGPKVVNHPRMADREIALRLIAFHVIPVEEYSNFESLEEFLGEVTRRLDSPDLIKDDDLTRLETLAKRGMYNAGQVFGEFAFRRWPLGQERKSPINRALVESFGTALSNLETAPDSDFIDGLRQRSRETMTGDLEFIGSISQSTGTVSNVRIRMDTAQRLVQEVLNAQ